MLLFALAGLAAPSAHGQESTGEQPPERAGRSIEGPGGTVVLTPQPLPPGELLHRDFRVLRTELLLHRADVLDTFVARLARQSRRLLEGDAPDCSALSTLGHALTLSLAASRNAAITVHAELPLLPVLAELAPLRERAQQVHERRGEVDQVLWPPLEADLRRACPSDEESSPTVWLPPEERTSVDGSSVIFVRAGDVDRVVWLDGQPAAVSDASGWAVLVAPTRPVRLCVSRPDKDDCSKLVEVDAIPIAAFDLSD